MGKWLALVALVACSSKSDPPKPKPAPVEQKKSMDIAVPIMEEPAIELPKQESFTLLDPGKGAQAELRYKLAEGTTTHRAETKLTSRYLQGPKWSDPIKLPAIRDGFAITVQGDKLLVRPLAAEIATKTPEAEAYIKTWKAIENRRVTAAFDARGQLSGITFADDPTNAHSTDQKDELVQRLLVSVVPLPAEPVAVGAKWKVVTALRQRPAVVKQTAIYTLEARTATSWKIAMKLQRVAEPQTLRDPALPATTTAELVALFRVLEGTFEIDPRRALPTGSLSVESRLHVRLTLPGPHVQEQILEDIGTVTLSTEN